MHNVTDTSCGSGFLCQFSGNFVQIIRKCCFYFVYNRNVWSNYTQIFILSRKLWNNIEAVIMYEGLQRQGHIGKISILRWGEEKRKSCFTGPTDSDFVIFLNFCFLVFPKVKKETQPCSGQKIQYFFSEVNSFLGVFVCTFSTYFSNLGEKKNYADRPTLLDKAVHP